MTRPTRTSSRTGARSTRARRASTSSSSNVPLIAGIVAAVVIVGVVGFLAAGGTDASSNEGDTKPAASAPEKPADRTPAPSSAPIDARARDGKPPEHPAPAIPAADFAKADEFFEEAKRLWNDGQRARSSGDTETYMQAMAEAFDAMESQREVLREYTDWYEQADLGDWAMPADYVALERRLGEYDRMYQKIKKVKQVEQPR